LLDEFAESQKSYVTSQFMTRRRQFSKAHLPGIHEASADQAALDEFNYLWATQESRLRLIPGKEALSYVNNHLQADYGVSLTERSIIDAMRTEEVPDEMAGLIESLRNFSLLHLE